MKILRIPFVIVLVVMAGRIYDINAQKLTTLYRFTIGTDGFSPEAGLVQGSDGNFYGTTSFGGAIGAGTVFRISPEGTLTTLHSFAFGADGTTPEAKLVQGNDGNFYGTTLGNGTNGAFGTVFQISPAGSLTTLYIFTGNADGGAPMAGLAQGIDGDFYGTTSTAGTGGQGTVFRISSAGTLTTLHSFTGDADGGQPEGGLVYGNDGNFYGTTSLGTVFQISSTGTLTTLHRFTGGADGDRPLAGLVRGNDGNFYGITVGGGTGDEGTVFRISSAGTLTTLHSFMGGIDGDLPETALVQGSDGNFYGTTGGNETAGDWGTVFRISTAGTLTTLHRFTGGAGGDTPQGSLVQDGGGRFFYGTTSGDLSKGDVGTVFKIDVGDIGGGGGCTYSLDATSIDLAAKGGSKTVKVKTSGTDCAWTAVSNDPFITITSGTSGTGNGKVNYTVPGNTNTVPLTGTMTIAGQTFTVNQAAGGCTYKLSPKSGKLKAAGGVKTVKVKPNFSDCAWTAVSNDPFITITGGASGVGKGTVSYTVAANTNNTAVTGSLTIGGETFTVTQAGEK